MASYASPFCDGPQNVMECAHGEEGRMTPIADQFGLDPATPFPDNELTGIDWSVFPNVKHHDTTMAGSECIWTFSASMNMNNLGEMRDIDGKQPIEMSNEYCFHNNQDVPLYPQNQMLHQQQNSSYQPIDHGRDFVPNMIQGVLPPKPTNSAGLAYDSELCKQSPPISTGLTLPSTPQLSPKTMISFLLNKNNGSEVSANCKVAREARDQTPEMTSPWSKTENELPKSRYVPILPKPGPASIIERSNVKTQSFQTTEKQKRRRAMDPPRKMTTYNPCYSPNTKYTQLSYPSEDWDCFEYTADGELDPARLYTAEELNKFIFAHPLGTNLALRIHRNPPRSRGRYPTTHSHRCRFADCPFFPNNTINQGHWAVSLDELTFTTPDHDPFINAGFVHLYCLERYTDFPNICAELNIHPETRKMPREPKGRNPMSLSTKAEEACVTKFIQACQRGEMPHTYPRFNAPDRPYEGTLSHRMACVKLRKEPRAIDGQRVAREQLAGRKGSTLRNHMGDLAREVELRGITRSHKNQNRQIANPRHRRIFKGENFRDIKEEGEESESSEDESVDSDKKEDGGSALENFRVPVPRRVMGAGEMLTMAGAKQFSLQTSPVPPTLVQLQQRGKKRGSDEAGADEPLVKKTKSDEAESDDEALRLEQKKLELQLKLIELKRKQVEKEKANKLATADEIDSDDEGGDVRGPTRRRNVGA